MPPKTRPLVNVTKSSDHQVYCGDCLHVLERLPEKSVDLVFADPPYHLQLKKDLYRPNQTKVAGVTDDWDKFASLTEYDHFTEKWLRACRRVMTDQATLWVIGSYHNIFRVGKIMMDLRFWTLNDIQWHKSNPMPNFRGVRFTNATETLIWAKKSEQQKKYTFNHHVTKTLNDGKQMTSVWKIPLCSGHERIKNADGKKAHSTQKPEELLTRIILASSHQGDAVLDPFTGTGTTSAVAKKLGRKSIGIEKEPTYIKIIKKRLAAIEPEKYKDLRLAEPTKKTALRVSMQQLIKANIVKENQVFYTKDEKYHATLQTDGTIKNGIGTGSIHKIGAMIKNSESCNGWKFWYYKNSGILSPIDEYRKSYFNRNLNHITLSQG